METIKPIKDLFNNYRIVSTKTRRSERGDLVISFVEKLNSARVGTKYPPLTIQRVAHLLSIYKDTGDLHILLKRCEQSKNFSATWWWYVLGKENKNG